MITKGYHSRALACDGFVLHVSAITVMQFNITQYNLPSFTVIQQRGHFRF